MPKIRRQDQTFPVGYEALIGLFGIRALPHYRKSYILMQGAPYVEKENHEEAHYYQKKYFLGDFQSPMDHLEFALKYDGINLEILQKVFEKLEPQVLEAYINSQPTSKLSRKIWYLYEFLIEKTLKINNTAIGSYTLLLDPDEYYTGTIIRSRRHYIDDNMLGGSNFCPIVRRTESLKILEAKPLSDTANQLIQQYDPAIISRAVNFLYMKETMSSYQIERKTPDSSRAQRFVEALKKADHFGVLSKDNLIDLQNMIVDPRYADRDYRDFQNYIGSEARLDVYRSVIDYIPPKPNDVPELMQGMISSLERMIHNKVHPVIMAAAISFGFVFIHPFEDGNGRIHRFIMHYIFARTGFVPKGAIFPISAVILNEIAVYDTLLESFSKPLMALIKRYTFDNQGSLTVQDETASYYRYVDYTHFANYLFDCVEKTIRADFEKELSYIINYNKAKKALQNVVDMPDKIMNQFIQSVLQNRGALSSKKKEDYFANLTESEIAEMESIIKQSMM